MTRKRTKPQQLRQVQPHSDSLAIPESPEMSADDRTNEEPGISQRQEAALPAIVLSPSIAQAARSSGLSERTLRRWMKDASFRSRLSRLRHETAGLAREEMQGLLLRSVTIMAEGMAAPEMATRIRSARHIQSFAVKMWEMEQLELDIRNLEEALAELRAKLPSA